MQFYSTNHLSHCELTVSETEREMLPSIGVSITLQNDGVSATLHDVWFEDSAIVQFLSELQSILDTNSGTARLESMSPGECVFELNRQDAAHAVVFRYNCATQGVSQGNAVQGDFSIDPGMLVSIQKDLQDSFSILNI